MDLNALSHVHALPLWFLVLSLFLPRISLLLLWLQHALLPFRLGGLIPLIFAIVLPRILILYLIYLDLGPGLWFIIHLVVALIVWTGAGHQGMRRRRSD